MLNRVNNGVSVVDRISKVNITSVESRKMEDLEKRLMGKTDNTDVILKEAIDRMNKTLEIFNVERRFVIDDRTKEVVVKIINKQTGEVIDQIPPEEVLERYYEMQRFIGLLFNKRV